MDMKQYECQRLEEHLAERFPERDFKAIITFSKIYALSRVDDERMLVLLFAAIIIPTQIIVIFPTELVILFLQT